MWKKALMSFKGVRKGKTYKGDFVVLRLCGHECGKAYTIFNF
jgi:hypothetical protein